MAAKRLPWTQLVVHEFRRLGNYDVTVAAMRPRLTSNCPLLSIGDRYAASSTAEVKYAKG